MAHLRNKRVLVLTVGTGDIVNLQKTLINPIMKSIRSEGWSGVILLPSTVTKEFATLITEGLPDIEVSIEPLPRKDAENDADACFAHFDSVMDRLKEQGLAAGQIMADFTRGTKAMSAALVLAAVRHGLPNLRYISGDRDQRGMVISGTEKLGDLHTTTAIAMRRVDAAVRFMKRGNFAAAVDLLPDPANPFSKASPDQVREAAFWLRPLAQFYAEWDRLDYAAAAQVALPTGRPAKGSWLPLAPSEDAVRWVRFLAEELPKEPHEMAHRLRRVAVDMLANGERRIRDRQFEDAVLRAYRVLELVGQIRLFDRGLDSAALPHDAPEVLDLEQTLEKRGDRTRFGRNHDGTLTAARELVARLLKRLGDPLAPKLLKLGNEGLMRASLRNKSLLIHGFAAVGPRDQNQLDQLFGQLLALMKEDKAQQVEAYLAVARSINLCDL